MQWQSLRHGRPGRRFQARYRTGQKAAREPGFRHKALRLLRLLVALGCVVVGVILVFIPGPAILFFLIAGSLLSTESMWVARFLDWAELELRAAGTWLHHHWKKMSRVGKVGVIALAVALVTAAACAAVYWFFIR